MLYTKKGDAGKTSLWGGKKTDKDDILIEAIGSIDELSSHLGRLKIEVKKEDSAFITQIQNVLYQIMSYLSGAKKPVMEIEQEVKKLEQQIDLILSKKQKQNRFILPGSTKVSSIAHIARSVCRRAERRLTTASKNEKKYLKFIKYLNRLSDFLFSLSRKYDQEEKTVFV